MRQCNGRNQWVPWAEVERFDILTRQSNRGVRYNIALIREGAKPLTTGGCSFQPFRKNSKMQTVQQTWQGLDEERPAASRRLGSAS